MGEPGPLHLRAATPSDSRLVYEIKRAAFREYVELVWGWDEEEQRRLHDRRFRSQDVRLIRRGDEDVGYVSVETHTDLVLVKQVFLLPEHQGRGIGRWCMERVLEEAGRLGLPTRLHVLRVNPRAFAFYERLGFVRIGGTETHVEMEHVP
jgi:GNAT superfamily N-acetyltransferase